MHRMPLTFLGAVLVLCAGSLSGSGTQKTTLEGKNAKSQPSGGAATIARGRDLYDRRCEICHFSESSAQKMGPGLKELYKRGKFSDGRKVDDASIEKWILNGSENMPPFKGELNPAQIHDLIAYLKTL
jgi:mono/diheme cytochrome c family protein